MVHRDLLERLGQDDDVLRERADLHFQIPAGAGLVQHFDGLHTRDAASDLPHVADERPDPLDRRVDLERRGAFGHSGPATRPL